MLLFLFLPLWYIPFCHTWLIGWAAEGARAAESRRVRVPAADPGPVEGVRARRRSSKSPRAWGEPCFSVHHHQRVSFSLRASCLSGLRFGQTPALAPNPLSLFAFNAIQLILRLRIIFPLTYS